LLQTNLVGADVARTVPFLKDDKMSDVGRTNIALRVVLALAGSAIIFLGLNVALGGITTLGWQGGTDFMAVIDATEFAIKDSHVRFIGGVWLAVGLLMLIGSYAFEAMKSVLLALMAMIFVGGLSRFSGLDFGTLFSAAIAPSLVLELVLFPALALWIVKAG
jgi:hypothetical protein